MDIENFNQLNKHIPSNVKLIAVCKTHPVEIISQLYHAGQRHFGENRVQELIDKAPLLPKDISWHLIGHLQTNKVRYIASFIACIQSVDSMKLLHEINKEGLKNGRIIDCLLQVCIAKEHTKTGLTPQKLFELLDNSLVREMQNIKICGLMGIATNTDNETQLKEEFDNLFELFKKIKGKYNTHNILLTELSMGMSGDYKIAIQAGSTMIRIGSLIFGQREYHK